MPLYEEAVRAYEETETFDLLSNVYYRKATAQMQLGQKPAACESLVKARDAAEANVKQNPGARQSLPAGVKSVAEFMDRYRAGLGCG